jgi:hypothetical protein
LSADGRKNAYFALWVVQGAFGMAGPLVIVLSLLGVVGNILWFIVVWVALEAINFLVRPWAWKNADTYRGPEGPVP